MNVTLHFALKASEKNHFGLLCVEVLIAQTNGL